MNVDPDVVDVDPDVVDDYFDSLKSRNKKIFKCNGLTKIDRDLIKLLPQWLQKQTPSINKVYLNNNYLNDDYEDTIASILKDPSVQFVNLNCNQFEGHLIGKSLVNNDSVNDLRICQNHICGTTICDSLKSNRKLQTLHIGQNSLRHEGGTQIGQSLETNKHLKILMLNNNELGPRGAVAIGQSLRTNNTLEELNLNTNQLGVESGNALGDGLHHNKSLRKLDLYCNNLYPGGAKRIGNALNTNSHLNELNLIKNKLDSEDGIALGEGLKNNNTLEKFHISYNLLGLEGGIPILSSLQTNSLLELKMDYTLLGPKAGVVIAQALRNNRTLQKFSINGNKLDYLSGIAIGQSLQTNNSLQELDLTNNNLGNDGALGIVQGIEKNRTSRITTLKLSNNNITRLPAELNRCRLNVFHYWGNPIDYIPPHVRRWLGRFQQQQNVRIHLDSQNVHNSQIQQCIRDSLNKIMNATERPKYQTLDEVRRAILDDNILSPQCKSQLIEYALDTSEHTSLEITFCEALQYVLTRIDMNQNRDEIKRILNREMSDALCMCFTGRISRLLNCLTVLDPLVHIHIVNLNDMFTNVGIRLMENAKYTTDAHQKQFEKELVEDYGYEMTHIFRNELEQKFYSEIEYFYDTYESQVQVKSNSKSESTSSSDTTSSLGKKRKFKESSEDSDDGDDETRKKQKVCNDKEDKK